MLDVERLLRKNKNARTKIDSGVCKYYPTNAVEVDIPFPFGNGRMTVARASDVQLRHVMFFTATKPP
jgi:hypothetical protein